MSQFFLSDSSFPVNALLLDRDGTLIKDKHYLSDPDGVELLPGVGRALALLAAQGLRFFMVSNQSGIGRGYFAASDAEAVNRRLENLLAEQGVVLTATLFCPHAPEAGCECRKPGTGMWRELQAGYGLKPEACAMVGDKVDDMGFAAAAGLALRVLVLTGHGRKAAGRLGLAAPPDAVGDAPPDNAAAESAPPPAAEGPISHNPPAGVAAEGGIVFNAAPASDAHPHFLLPSLADLPEALEVYARSRRSRS